MANQAFTFVGARTVVFRITLQNNTRFSYRFSDKGIPANARILYINYTPNQGGLFPTELHGNLPIQKYRGDEVFIFPTPMANDGEPTSDTNVSVMVSWVQGAGDSVSFDSLVEAFEAYAASDFSSMIVPANVAVESSLSRLLNQFLNLKMEISKDRIERFFDAASYSHQLNVLLPLISKLLNLPQLPNQIRGALNNLNARRNQIAHSGQLETSLDKNAAAELLCASLFGLHYVRYLEFRIFHSN